MAYTIFDLVGLLGNNGMWFWYIIFVALIGVWAKSKNRNPWNWIALAFFISPLLAGLFLLFSGKLKETEEGFVYCSNCGAKNKEGTKFCPECGKNHNKKEEKKESSPYSFRTFTKEVIIPEKHHKIKEKVSHKWDFGDIGLILLPIMLLGLGIYFYFYSPLNVIPVILTLIILTPLFEKGFKFIFKKSTFKWTLLRKGLLISAIVIVFIIINLIIPRCPQSCEDTTPCTKDICSAETGYKCLHIPQLSCDGNGICESGEYGRSTDCPNCDDGSRCTADSYDSGAKKCIHMQMKGCI